MWNDWVLETNNEELRFTSWDGKIQKNGKGKFKLTTIRIDFLVYVVDPNIVGLKHCHCCSMWLILRKLNIKYTNQIIIFNFSVWLVQNEVSKVHTHLRESRIQNGYSRYHKVWVTNIINEYNLIWTTSMVKQ